MNTGVFLKDLFYDFGSLFFPAYCAGCGTPLQRGEEAICLNCLARLPRTRMHDLRNNRLEQLFAGRVDIEMATAFLHMPRSGLVHHLVHELKYRGNQQVGVVLGKLFGEELLRSSSMNRFDGMVSVPLHERKRILRGYNQCDAIAGGLKEAMDIPYWPDRLVRRRFSESQTRKSRMERWNNMDSIFDVQHPGELDGQHLLLIDDVITTGSTIEACCQALLRVPGLRVSVAALAMPLQA